jgi:hypothetical protein
VLSQSGVVTVAMRILPLARRSGKLKPPASGARAGRRARLGRGGRVGEARCSAHSLPMVVVVAVAR